MKFIVNKTNAILSGFMVLFMGGFGLFYLSRSMYPEAPVFLIAALIFGYLFIKNAAAVVITQEYISHSFLGLERKRWDWAEIKEMGIIGENVFNRKKERTGHKYIYFSTQTMSQKERFDMIVKWPPKNMAYIEYSEKALEYAMSVWGKELKAYNVEDLFPNTED